MSKVIIFDLDGVLFDTIAFHREHALRHHPTLTLESWRDLSKGNFHDNWAKFKETIVDYVELSTEEEERRQKEFDAEKALLPMFPGMYELLTRLRMSGFVIALNTSAKNDNCVPLLEKSGILSMFDYIGTSEISKSKVEKFKLISERFSVAPEGMLFITDTIGDILEAQEMGVPTIAVTWGVHERESFNDGRFPNLVGIAGSVEELSSLIPQDL